MKELVIQYKTEAKYTMLKNFIIFIFSLLSLISLVINFRFYQQTENQNIVVEVVDGDTFQLKSGKRVRLKGVDAPEYDRCGGKEAKERLTQLILNKKVKLTEETQESFGRSLALVYLNGTLINKIILEEGWGRTDYQKNSQRTVLTAAFHQAQQDKIGIWSSLCRELPRLTPSSDCLIKGNIDKATYQKFYHLPGCKHYNQVIIEKDIGERYFCSEEEAIKAGFLKASGCP
jgi:micrococcal nuclease